MIDRNIESSDGTTSPDSLSYVEDITKTTAVLDSARQFLDLHRQTVIGRFPIGGIEAGLYAGEECGRGRGQRMSVVGRQRLSAFPADTLQTTDQYLSVR